ncbi:MAG: nucleoid-associated protein, partial [Bacteroidaceae bacterium]|nr:nucleoid-associated protein [Bacteroidaceae bacterium]MBO5951295.1 nucleoid-associated protein [Bacteroidaceae bacterium]
MNKPKIEALALHYVGNQANDEPFLLSKKLFATTPDMNELLSDYFLGSFKSEERYQFADDMG